MKILTALISALTALIISIISLIKSFLIANETGANARRLEIIKHSLDINDEELRKTLQALRNAIQVIQKIKEEIYLIIMSVDGSLDPPSTLERISQIREELVQKFQNSKGLLNEEEREAFHKAKGFTLKIEPQLKKVFSQEGESYSLPEQIRNDLTYIRSELTERQQILRDGISDRLMRRSFIYE